MRKYFKKSKKYKYVYIYKNRHGELSFDGKVGPKKRQCFKTERECALWVDKQLIEIKKDPVNILVKKEL